MLNDLVNKTSPDYRGSTQQIIFKLANDGLIDKERVRFGKTKVFFRTGEAAKIETLREQKVGGMISVIQAIARAYVSRRMYAAQRAQKEGLKLIQRAMRQYLTLSKVRMIRASNSLCRSLGCSSTIESTIFTGDVLSNSRECKNSRRLSLNPLSAWPYVHSYLLL